MRYRPGTMLTSRKYTPSLCTLQSTPLPTRWSMAGSPWNSVKHLYLWVSTQHQREDGTKTAAGFTSAWLLGKSWHDLRVPFKSDPPSWIGSQRTSIFIKCRWRSRHQRTKNARFWTKLVFGWSASILIDRRPYSWENRRRSKKICEQFFFRESVRF